MVDGRPAPSPTVAEDWLHGGFGLYVHWPFCAALCPYCDFNTYVADTIDEDRWRQAFTTEIARIAAETGPRVLSSIFFGGGTPSLMSPALVGSIVEEARSAWSFDEDIEVTLEANPTSVEAGRFEGYRDAGVNRVSLGVQALNDDDLRRLGRRHDTAQARAAIDTARRTFDRVSFDLIYARQDQTLAAWRQELNEALALSPDHLSLYQLTIEPGTAFGQRLSVGRLPGLPDDDLGADHYDLTQEICEAAGLDPYEVSNHAAPGAASRHNLIYWRTGDWAGIGPGAHGRLTLEGTRWATETHLTPDVWLKSIEKGSGESSRDPVEDRGAELLLMGLRLQDGVSLSRHRTVSGYELPDDRLAMMTELGLVCSTGDRLSVTTRGRPVLNGVLRELLSA